jgi:hypothetical protein
VFGRMLSTDLAAADAGSCQWDNNNIEALNLNPRKQAGVNVHSTVTFHFQFHSLYIIVNADQIDTFHSTHHVDLTCHPNFFWSQND